MIGEKELLNFDKKYNKAKSLFCENQYKKALKLFQGLSKINVFIDFYICLCELNIAFINNVEESKIVKNRVFSMFRKLMPKFVKEYEKNPIEENKFIMGYLYTNKDMNKYYDWDKGFQMIKRAAKDGYAPAQDEYARLIQYNIVVNKDLSESDRLGFYNAAIVNYEKASKQGYGRAMYHLAECYSYGYMGIKINKVLAMKYYKEGAKHNFLVCNTDIAACALYDNTIIDKKEAFDYLNTASKQGYARADRFLSIYYFNGYGCEQDINKAIKIAKRSAQNGHIQSYLVLYNIYSSIGNKNLANKYGKEYFNSLDTIKDNAHMKKFYYEHMGTCFAEGIGTRKNIPKAIKYYKLGGENPYNYTLCLNKLAEIYLDENSIYHSWLDGKKCLTKAVEMNDNTAICRIAKMYLEDGDNKNAKKYYQLGVDNNIPEAYLELGKLYAKEKGQERHAIDLLKFAYNAGIEAAEYPLEQLNNQYTKGKTAKTTINLEGLDLVIDNSKDSMLNFQALEAINTAIIVYKQLNEYNNKTAEKVDYSPVITLLAKAVEIEFKKYFKTIYIKYLIEKGRRAEDYKNISGLVIFDNYNKTCRFDLEGVKPFTMGDIIRSMDIEGPRKVPFERINKILSIPFTKDESNRIVFNNKSFVEYFDYLFTKEAFDETNRREELLIYLYNLHEDLKFLKDFLRNNAVHTSCMNVFDADLTISLILTSKKMLFNFVDKIKVSLK